MIHYHGTPLSSLANAAKVLAGRHALASHATAGSFVNVLAEVCQSFVLDNGAFTAWRSGKPVTDWLPVYDWYSQWIDHPGCDWALIPDDIEGDERANDALAAAWPFGKDKGVPVWHYHESPARLARLADEWPRVALGSSGDYAVVGTPQWWARTGEAMRVACDADGRPRVKLHGLRMLNPDVFTRLPLASADSCNAGRNCGAVGNRLGLPPDAAAEVIIRRIESNNSAARWAGAPRTAEGTLFSLALPEGEVA